MSPIGMAGQLATYIADPSTIRVRVLEHFGRAPTLEQCQNLRNSFERRHFKRNLCAERFTRFKCGHDATEDNTIAGADGIDRCKACHDEAERLKTERELERIAAWKREAIATRARRQAFEALTERKNYAQSEVLAEVCKLFGCTIEDFKDRHNKKALLVDARTVAAVLLRDRGLSFPVIGKLMDRDHTSIVYLMQRFPARAENRPRVLEALGLLR
jgi:chromosomal replication initiation ATPase DnaA